MKRLENKSNNFSGKMEGAEFSDLHWVGRDIVGEKRAPPRSWDLGLQGFSQLFPGKQAHRENYALGCQKGRKESL